MGTGYEWHHYHGASFGGLPCSFALCYHLGSLQQLNFGVSITDAEIVGGWPTRASSEREIAFVRMELAQQLGRSFSLGGEHFPWGEVWSSFDAKGACASSGLRYSSAASTLKSG
ncbi:hypothetical protein GCM10009097_09900 [Pigmentiphaga daeguensis]|uniref:Uncharacterized protein n=1 Tax=Pigmentiphaga daeguensis TaxID=414049 RepID=A0ABN1BEU5_9BURK